MGLEDSGRQVVSLAEEGLLVLILVVQDQLPDGGHVVAPQGQGREVLHRLEKRRVVGQFATGGLQRLESASILFIFLLVLHRHIIECSREERYKRSMMKLWVGVMEGGWDWALNYLGWGDIILFGDGFRRVDCELAGRIHLDLPAH